MKRNSDSTSSSNRRPRRRSYRTLNNPESGFGLIEVLISSVILLGALLATASLLATAMSVGGNSRLKEVATDITTSALDCAQSQGASVLLNQMGYTSPSSVCGGHTVVKSGVTYSVEQEVTPGTTGCVAPASGNASGLLNITEFVAWGKTTNTPSWWTLPANSGAYVTETSFAPVPASALTANDGSLLVQVQDAYGAAQYPVSVTLSPPPTGIAPTVNTDSNGCALFANISPGTYSVTLASAGRIGPDETPGTTTSTVTVPTPPTGTAGTPTSLIMQFAAAGALSVNYQVAPATISGTATTPANPSFSSALPLSLYNTELPTNPFITASTSSLYPFAPTSYSVIAGDCGTDSDPNGLSTDGTAANVTEGGSSSTTLTLAPIQVVVENASNNNAIVSNATVTATPSNLAGTATDPNCSTTTPMPTITLGNTSLLSDYTRNTSSDPEALVSFLKDNSLESLLPTSPATQNPDGPPVILAGSFSPDTSYTGTLSGPSSVVEGTNITFSYSTTGSDPSGDNWIGLYSNPGCGPVNGTDDCSSTEWGYTPYYSPTDGQVGNLSGTGTGTSGTLTFATSSLSPGNYVAFYLYDSGYTSIAAPIDFTVTAPSYSTTTKVTTSPTTVNTAAAVTYSATVTSSAGTPTGTVAFTSGSTTLCTTGNLSSGTASCSATNAPVGADSIVGTYTPSSGSSYVTSTSSGSNDATLYVDNITLTSSSTNNTSAQGASVTFTATVSPSTVNGPNDGVTFYVNGTPVACQGLNGSTYTNSSPPPTCSTTSSNNVATYTTSTLALGSNTITAAFFSGSGSYTFDSVAISQTVDPSGSYAYTLSGLPDGTYLLSASSGSLNSANSSTKVVVVVTGSASNNSFSITVYNNGTQVGSPITPTTMSPIVVPIHS